MWTRLSREAQRTTFGRDPAAYAFARPEYPDAVYSLLEARCGLGPGARVFEIGAGSGLATRELLRRGAGPLTVLEPDARFARYLRRSLRPAPGSLTIRAERFEAARLPSGAFDLGVSATAFHWLPERRALGKVARLLRPGGWWAAWWTVFGDPGHPSEFQRAIDPLFRRVPTGPRSQLRAQVPPQLDRRARVAALRGTGTFRRVSCRLERGRIRYETPRLVALYATFSPIALLPARRRREFLGALARIADGPFEGRVPIEILTPIYTAQRI